MAKSILAKLKPVLKKHDFRKKINAKETAHQVTEQYQGKKLTKKELELIKKRDELINQYMPYAASIASRVCQTLSSAVDYEDVLCNARLGLLEAAKRFDLKEEVDFRTFAYYRIKGAIYDGLRRSGWLPRTLYAKLKFEEASNEYLQYKSSSATKSADFHAEDEAVETVNTLASIYIISMDASDDFEIADDKVEDIEKKSEFLEIRNHMREAIGTLPEKEKQLVKMYYFQNKTLEEIGERLGLSKSWTSRLHARALSLLFKRIKQKSAGSENVQDKIEEQPGGQQE
ncbi:MAG: sigma-70 family RNA polymerase sigma factor [Pseudomonadota bacterium]